VPERSPVVPGHEKSVRECAGPYVGVGELVEREPTDIQMVFPTDGFYVGDGDLEHEIEFMVGNVVFDLAVLNNADEPSDLGVGTSSSAISRTRVVPTHSPGSTCPPGRNDHDLVRWRARSRCPCRRMTALAMISVVPALIAAFRVGR
jgi:hypothetical protein